MRGWEATPSPSHEEKIGRWGIGSKITEKPLIKYIYSSEISIQWQLDNLSLLSSFILSKDIAKA